jgi:hypothetical protein
MPPASGVIGTSESSCRGPRGLTDRNAVLFGGVTILLVALRRRITRRPGVSFVQRRVVELLRFPVRPLRGRYAERRASIRRLAKRKRATMAVDRRQANEAHRLATECASAIERLLQAELELWKAIDEIRGERADARRVDS